MVSIQYMRAAAAVAVVLAHASGALLGNAGVDIFFVISGFIMWTITETPMRPRTFLWHRLIRIVPLYWTATLVMAWHQGASKTAVVSSLLFMPYFGEQGRIWPVLVPGWTLNYEMFFYVLVGVSLVISRRPNALRLLAAILCILSFSRLFYASDDPILLTYTNPIILEFLAGIIIAELRFRSLLPQVPSAILLILLGIAGFWFSPLHDSTDIYRFIWWGVPSLLVIAGIVSLEAHNRMIRSTILGALGDASYSIYLCHTFMVKMVLHEFSALPAVAGITAALVVACSLGLFVFRFLERPATAWLRSFANHEGNARSIRSRQGILVPNPRS